jgi:hypothetical protein
LTNAREVKLPTFMRRIPTKMLAHWLALILFAASGAIAGSNSPVREAARSLIAERVDGDRAANGLPPLAFAHELNGALDAWCEQQIREGTVGHFSLDGFPPYARYSAIGVADAVLENAVAWSANYRFEGAAILDLARRSQDAMMAERPPRDSHRKTILDPHATHLGVGIAWVRGEFRMVQLLLRKNVEWATTPAPAARAGERISVTGTAREGWDVIAATLHWEQLPRSLSAAAANRIESYDLPAPHRRWAAQPPPSRHDDAAGEGLARFAGAMREDGGLTVAAGGKFVFRGSLDNGPGIYTLVVWLREPRTGVQVASSHISTVVRTDPSAYPAGARR